MQTEETTFKHPQHHHTMEPLLNVPEIIKRAKEVLGFSKDVELANYLGISRSTLSNWGARNAIDFPLLLEKMSDVDYNWLLLGKGSPIHRPHTCRIGESTGEVETLYHPKFTEKRDERSVALYDVTAAANLRTLLTNRHQYLMGEIIIPSIPSCDGAVFISGDSMYPILKSGDIVGFKEINNLDHIIYGEMYLVSFRLDDNDYLAVKYVKQSDVEGCIRLVSYNPHHEPMDLPKENIQAMGLVKFSVRKNMML